MNTGMRVWREIEPAILAVVTAMVITACSVNKTAAPALTGPSEFGLSVTMNASPDQLPRDGSSQSVVTVTARGSDGTPLSGQQISLSMPVDAPAGATLSQSVVTTGANGSATVTVTAPVVGSLGDILISATPVGTNSQNAIARTLSIDVLPRNTVGPSPDPSPLPVPTFTVNPTSPEVGVAATFAAGDVLDEGVKCTNLCTFTWSFGDGSTANGQVVTHSFAGVGVYSVTLTVTDRAGTSRSVTQPVTVIGVTPPTGVSFTASPVAPLVGVEVTFSATATAQAGHRIVTYDWSWGDGTSNQTGNATIRHTYSRAGTYLVLLTVTDDRGQSTKSQQQLVVSTGLAPTFTVTPSSPKVNVQAAFDATGTTTQGGSAIATYSWDFGDGQTSALAQPTVTHTYSTQGTYVVTLTVTDGRGQSSSTSKTVTVTP